MEHYCKSSHIVHDLKYHLVWITKYPEPVLTGEVAIRLRKLIRETSKARDVEILKGHISRGDHMSELLDLYYCTWFRDLAELREATYWRAIAYNEQRPMIPWMI